MSVPISKPEGPSDTKISPKHNVAALTDFFDLTHDLILLKLISWCKAGMFRKSVIWPLFDSIFNVFASSSLQELSRKYDTYLPFFSTL